MRACAILPNELTSGTTKVLLHFSRSQTDHFQAKFADGILFRDAFGNPPSNGAVEALHAIENGSQPGDATKRLHKLTDTALLLDNSGKLHLIRGGASKTRLYFSLREGLLHVWDSLTEDLITTEPRSDLIAFTTAHTLFGPFETRASHETALKDVFCARPAGITTVRVVNAKLLISFEEILHDDLDSIPDNPTDLKHELRNEIDKAISEPLSILKGDSKVAFEISGGMDSTTVALRAKFVMTAQNIDPERRFGISIGYPYFEFRRECKFIDSAYEVLAMSRIMLDGSKLIPFEGWSHVVAHDEPSLCTVGFEQHRVGLAAASSHGAALLFNGFGGDTIFGFGPGKQFDLPALPLRPNWMNRRGWATLSDHWQSVCSYYGIGEQNYHRQYYSGAYIEDGWADIHLSPQLRCKRVCAFTRTDILRITARLWQLGGGRPPYKKILRETFRGELPEPIASRPHKIPYDGLYVRGYRRQQNNFATLINKHADRLFGEGIDPNSLIAATNRLAKGRMDGDMNVSVVLTTLLWLQSRAKTELIA